MALLNELIICIYDKNKYYTCHCCILYVLCEVRELTFSFNYFHYLATQATTIYEIRRKITATYIVNLMMAAIIILLPGFHLSLFLAVCDTTQVLNKSTNGQCLSGDGPTIRM